MKRETQRETLLRLLKAAGTSGVSTFDLIYGHGITRGAAIVYDLREDGYDIRTHDEGDLPDGHKRLARYELRPKASVAKQMTAWD